MQRTGLCSQRVSKSWSRAGSEESVSNKTATIDTGADVPWTHSEKHRCVREACPRKEVEGYSLLGFEKASRWC